MLDSMNVNMIHIYCNGVISQVFDRSMPASQTITTTVAKEWKKRDLPLKKEFMIS